MEQLTVVEGIVAPLARANIDTDAIIPKQYLKSIKRSGFGPNLFDEWRYCDHGEPGMDCTKRPKNSDFVLNQERYHGASILLTEDNFGCGSSREHAVWALLDAGFRVVIAPSFAEIFYNNACKNGLLPVTLAKDIVLQLFAAVNAEPGYRLRVDLPQRFVEKPDGEHLTFSIESFNAKRLQEGLDDIAMTLKHTAAIKAFEDRWRQQSPWLF